MGAIFGNAGARGAHRLSPALSSVWKPSALSRVQPTRPTGAARWSSLTEVGRQAAFKADQVLRDINTETGREKLGEDDADALQDMLTPAQYGRAGLV